MNVETSPTVQVMRPAAAYMNSMVFASSMVAVHMKMLFVVLELSTAALAITPFVISKKGSVSRYDLPSFVSKMCSLYLTILVSGSDGVDICYMLDLYRVCGCCKKLSALASNSIKHIRVK